jgi:hypothetical protein
MGAPWSKPLARGAIAFFVVLVADLTAMSPANAKAGPSQIVIEGPALSSPVALRDRVEPPSPALAIIVEETGFYSGLANGLSSRNPPSVFRHRRRGNLGPRYTVTYTLPGPGTSTVRQYVFPYAAPGPVVHMPPGQQFWSTNATVGGWHVAGARLKTVLIDVGLPETPPSAAESAQAHGARTLDSRPFALWVAAGVTALGAAILLLLRLLHTGAGRRSAIDGPSR